MAIVTNWRDGTGNCVRCDAPGAPLRRDIGRHLCEFCWTHFLEQRRPLARGPIRDHIDHQFRLPPLFSGGAL